MRVLLTLVVVLFFATVSACLLEDNPGPGLACSQDAECPADYRCAPDVTGQRFCEIIYPPPSQLSDAGPGDAGSPDGGRPDGGGPISGGTDAGTDGGVLVVPSWCGDIQTIMANSCALNCHGATKTGSGRNDFRLDVYETAGGVKGALEMAGRIKVRAVDQQNMPPASRPDLTFTEINLIDRWIAAGAPQCPDAGTP